MSPSLRSLASAGLIVASWTAPALAADLQYIEPDVAAGISAAVVAPESAGLVQTTQLLPVGADGAVLGGDNPAAQFDAVLGHLKAVLSAAGSDVSRIARLHVYAASDEAAAAARKSIAAAFAEIAKPAATIVVTPLPHPKALVALDAIAVPAKPPAERRPVQVRVGSVPGGDRFAHAVVYPAGQVAFISGQAEPGNLAEATKKTMQSLHETLKFLGMEPANVVQVKSFLRPMSDVAAAEKEIAAFYPAGLAPPVAHVEWTYSSPIEIELVAVGSPAAAPPADPMKYLAPPHLKHSPVFSRIAVAEGASLVFVSGLSGAANTTGEQQVRSVFDRLQAVLKLAGSDLKYLAKATYYVSHDDPSNALNTVRPELYDPQRPPAASKAGVKSVAVPGAGLVLDMIAVKRR